MRQEQSTLIKVTSAFSAEIILFQHRVLGYRIDAYFPKYKPAIEIDELRHKSRDINQEIERQKLLEKHLNCVFIQVNPAKENSDIFFEIGRI